MIDQLKSGLADEFSHTQFDFSEIDNPRFEQRSGPHDWRMHIPNICILLWSELSDEAKIVLYAIAQYQADNEEWE